MVKNHWGFFYRGKLKQFSNRSRRQTDVHGEDFLQSPPGGLPPESTGSSFRVCSFGGQVHPVCCAWPGTFSVTVTFTTWWTGSAQPQRISSIQMKWENFRKKRAQSSFCLCKSPCQLLGWIHHTFILPFDKELPSVSRWKASSGSFPFISLVGPCSHLIPKATSDYLVVSEIMTGPTANPAPS